MNESNHPDLEHYPINKGVSLGDVLLADVVDNIDHWIMEPLIDGTRLLVYFQGDRTYILDTSNHFVTGHFVRATYEWKYESLHRTVPEINGTVLDGVVVEDEAKSTIFVAFDCLIYKGLDLRTSKLITRRKALLRIIGTLGASYTIIEKAEPKSLDDLQSVFKYGNGFVLKHLEGSYYPTLGPNGIDGAWIKWRKKNDKVK